MTIERRIAFLERALGGAGWDDDLLRAEAQRAAIEHGLDEGDLYGESLRVLQFAEEGGLAVDPWAFTEAWARETGEDINVLAAGLERLRQSRAEE